MKAEQERLISVYKKQPNSAVYNLFKDKYHMYVACPGDYIVNKDIDGFVWISRETRTDGRGIIFFEKEYKDASQFHVQAIVDTVNAELKRNIPDRWPIPIWPWIQLRRQKRRYLIITGIIMP